MNSTLLNSFIQLFKLNWLATKRESGKEIKTASTILRGLSLVFFFALAILWSVIVFKQIRAGELNLHEGAKIVALALGPMLAYDFLIRISLPSYILEELPVLFTLPLEKRHVILFKLFYHGVGPLVIMWVVLITPILGSLNYFNVGILGYVHAFLIMLLVFTINKQVIVLAKNYFSKHKVVTTTSVILYFLVVFLPLILYKFDAVSQAYGSILVPLNHYWPTYLILLLLLGVTLSLTYQLLRNFKIDSLGDDGSDNSFQFNSLTKSERWSKMGQLGQQIRLDLLFLLRTKKMRALLLVILFFTALPIYTILSNPEERVLSSLNFPYVYSAIMFYMTYVQYESISMEFYFTQRNHMVTLLKSKYIITTIATIPLLIAGIVCFLYRGFDLWGLIALYSYIPGLISLFGLSMYIFNSIGINPEAKTKVNKSFSGIIFLFILVAAASVPLINWIISLIVGQPYYENLTIIILNLGVVLLSPIWLKLIAKSMNNRKYKNLEGIRNSLN